MLVRHPTGAGKRTDTNPLSWAAAVRSGSAGAWVTCITLAERSRSCEMQTLVRLPSIVLHHVRHVKQCGWWVAELTMSDMLAGFHHAACRRSGACPSRGAGSDCSSARIAACVDSLTRAPT